jgi:ABC-type transport system involved in multi-copper enzyme maturation permease subunit
MSLQDKIEAIRRKPEHVRLRYVWIMVIIVMLFILIIWFFSLKSGQIEKNSTWNKPDVSKLTKQFNEGKQTLENINKSIKLSSEQSESNY